MEGSTDPIRDMDTIDLELVMSDMEMTVAPSLSSVAVAFGISVGIGVLFGYLPAKRAARLNPIEALRYD